MLGSRYDRDTNTTHFRVWAPDASEVVVTGRFCHWDQNLHHLTEADRGYWIGSVAGVRPDDPYKFIMYDRRGGKTWRMDPAARDTIHSGLDLTNAGLVVDPAWPWHPFRRPRFHELIIYQAHVGAFSGLHDAFASGHVGTFDQLQAKLGYIKELGFNALQLLPVQEFCMSRSWGYNPSWFFAPESGYGSPAQLRQLVDQAHRQGLAVIFDVVFNHVADDDNSLWGFDVHDGHGVYLHDGATDKTHRTPWGWAPAQRKQPVKDFFFENARMYLQEYNADGLRFDATRHNEHAGGWPFLQDLTWRLKEAFPDRYLVAEHLPDHDSIVRSAGFHATWVADCHHEWQRAADGDDPINKVKGLLGQDWGYGRSYPHAWNVVKYLLGSHDDCGDDKGGASTDEGEDWKRHRYFVEWFGGRGNWWARSKARLGWALNAAVAGTPLMFMGNECHMWGYWHDRPDDNGDHRFDWSIAGDPVGMTMRRLVAAANWLRCENPALQGPCVQVTHEDHINQVIAFKRWAPGIHNTILVVANLGDRDFDGHRYGVGTGGQTGQWTQLLCTQDADFGGWDGAGNAYREPWTQPDGRLYLNVPKWSLIMMRLR